MDRVAAGRVAAPGRRRAGAAALTAAALAAAVSGCGGSSAASTTAVVADGVATAGTATSPQISRKLKAEEAAIHRKVQASLDHPDARAHYAGLPKDLRDHQRPPRNQILYSRPGHAAEAIQGIPIRMRLSNGASALVIAVGPYVPDRDQGSFRNHTNASWDVTFSEVRGTVPIVPRVFTITDEQGHDLSPRLSVRGGGAVPRVVPPGRAFTLVLHARTSIGDGKVRYSPQGGHLLAEWDFDAETD